MQAIDLIPTKGQSEYYFKSDYANDVLSLFKCKLDSNDWVMKMNESNSKHMVYKFEVHSLFNKSSLGKISHEIRLLPLNNEEGIISWKIVYSSDLSPQIIEAMNEKRQQMMKIITNEKP